MKDLGYYKKILGIVDKYDEKSLKQAFYDAVKTNHPDKFKKNQNKELATKKMKLINEAYDFLKLHINEQNDYSNSNENSQKQESDNKSWNYNEQESDTVAYQGYVDKKKSKTNLIYLLLTIVLCVYNLLSPINYDFGFASIKVSYNPIQCTVKGKISFLGTSQDVEKNDVSIIEYIGLKKELKKTNKTNVKDIFENYTKSNYNTNKSIKSSGDYFGTSYERAIQDNTKPMIILFYADWNQDSQRFMPIYEKMYESEKKYYNFVKINVEDSKYIDVIKKYDIVDLPTVFLVNTKTDERKQLENKDFGHIDLLLSTMVRFATRCGYYL